MAIIELATMEVNSLNAILGDFTLASRALLNSRWMMGPFLFLWAGFVPNPNTLSHSALQATDKNSFAHKTPPKFLVFTDNDHVELIFYSHRFLNFSQWILLPLPV
jgi:hypothetical protein